MEQENKEVLTETDLAQFIGTEHYWTHWTKMLVYTDGVKFLADKAGAYWLIDAIAAYQPRKEKFQVWELFCFSLSNNGAVLIMKEDSNQPELVRQVIPYTDFPLKEIKLYLIDDGTRKVLLLPSEH